MADTHFTDLTVDDDLTVLGDTNITGTLTADVTGNVTGNLT